MTYTNTWLADQKQQPITAAPSDPRDNLDKDAILLLWQQSKDVLAAAKQSEMELRKYVVKRAFPQAQEGMNTQELGNGFQLKASIKFNYNLIPDLDQVEKALDDIASMGNEGAFLADRLVKWEASFLLTEYRKLCEDDATEIQRKIKKRIDDVLIITDAAPSLEIKQPKSKK